MAQQPFYPYAKQSISQGDLKAVSKALKSDMITRGPEVAQFEEDIAKYCGVEFAVAFSSGTEALTGACFAAELSPYDRLITSPNSFLASATAALRHQAKVFFGDIDLKTGCADNANLLQHIETPLSRGKYVIMPIHYGGIASDMQKLHLSVKHEQTVIIEDACAAFGSLYETGEKVGSCLFSDMAVFSFHPAKTLTTGEGGMVVTNDALYANRLKMYRNNGITKEHLKTESPGPWYFESQFIGANNNFTDFQAALGRSQLKRLGKSLEKRHKLAKKYRSALKDCPHLTLFEEKYDELSAHNMYFVRIDFSKLKFSKAQLMQQLKEQGVGTQVHYIPIYHHPFYQEVYGDLSGQFPNMERFYQEALTLPLYHDLTEHDVDIIAKKLCKLLSNKP